MFQLCLSAAVGAAAALWRMQEEQMCPRVPTPLPLCARGTVELSLPLGAVAEESLLLSVRTGGVSAGRAWRAAAWE